MAEQVINVAKESSIQNIDLELDTVRNELTALKSELAIVKNAIANSGGSVIKSIQRGVYQHSADSNGQIAINTVDPNKCFVLLNDPAVGGLGGHDIYSYTVYNATLVSLTSNMLTITKSYKNQYYNGQNNPYDYGTTSWQVIEFN